MMPEDRIVINEERGNDAMLRDQGIWDEVINSRDKIAADLAEEDAKVSAMKPGDDGLPDHPENQTDTNS